MYFGTYELVKELAGGNVDDGHHPVAAGEFTQRKFKITKQMMLIFVKALSGAAATIASDALMNPFDGTISPHKTPARSLATTPH